MQGFLRLVYFIHTSICQHWEKRKKVLTLNNSKKKIKAQSSDLIPEPEKVLPPSANMLSELKPRQKEKEKKKKNRESKRDVRIARFYINEFTLMRKHTHFWQRKKKRLTFTSDQTTCYKVSRRLFISFFFDRMHKGEKQRDKRKIKILIVG